MKKLFCLLFFSSFVFLISSCEEDVDVTPEQIQFSFATVDNTVGRTASLDLPEGSSVIISLTNSKGERVFTYKNIAILEFGGSIVTEPLDLPPGRYQIEDFLVVDGGSQVLFATPKRGSKLARLVTHSLPYNFVVSKNDVNTVAMEVVSVENSTPEALGYVSFELEAVYPWQLAVFISKNEKLHLTDARVLIKDGETVVSSFEVKPKITLLGFKGDPDKTYQLVVIKKGYEIFTRSFVYNDLFNGSSSHPLEIILDNGPELTVVPQEDPQFWMTFEGSGTVTIDWGDGQAEELNFSAFEGENTSYYYRDHTYGENKTGITIFGDIEQLTEFISAASIGSIDVSNAPALKTFIIEHGSVDTLNLSHNTQLQSIAFHYTSIDHLVMPEDHMIEYVSVEGDEGQSVPSVPLETLVLSVYQNTREKNLTEGAFILFNAGEISDTILARLTELQDAYSWYVGTD